MNQSQVGAEWLPVSDGTVPMSDEARGHAIKRRRLQLGINSLREFADQTGVARQTISRAEEGDGRTTETTYARLEMFLERLESERPSSDGTTPALVSQPEEAADDNRVVEYRLSGDFGVDLIVKGPVANIAEMEASIGRLLARMRTKDDAGG